MKANLLTSVGAKLFYLMSALVLITVAGNSFQYGKTFLAYQTQQVQDSTQLYAERAGEQFANTIDGWRAQVAVALPTLKGGSDAETAAQIKKFVDASPEFIGLAMFSAPGPRSPTLTTLGEAFTSSTTDARFEEKDAGKVFAAIKTVSRKWLRREIPKGRKTPVLVEGVSKSVGLPVVLMAVRFEVNGSQQVVWAVLAAWQTNLIKALPKSRSVSSAVIDKKGKVVSSHNMSDVLQRRAFAGKPLAAAAKRSGSPAGFEPEYRAEGRRWLGAFFKIPRYDFTVLVQQDAEEAYLTLRRNLLSTALWAVLFMLFAVMFSLFGAAGITKGLRSVANATSRIASGDFRFQIQPETKDEVGHLAMAVNNMAGRIVGLMQTQVDKAKIEKELETAKMVQGTFFPKADIKISALSVTGFYQPATQCGGDLWGHCPLAPGVDLLFVADAMGHGAPAALVTAMAYSTTMTVADIVKEQWQAGDDPGPAKLLDRMNRIIYEAVRGNISMTFFAAVIDSNRGVVTYANAGHNFPLVVAATPGDPRAGKAPKSMAKKSDVMPFSLKLRGTPLGMDPTTRYAEATLELKAGDKFFLFTDGLIECQSPQGGVWGRKFLVEQLAETAKLSAEETKTEILTRAFSFFATKPLDDDVTVVVAEIDKTWKPSAAPKAKAKAKPVVLEAEAVEDALPQTVLSASGAGLPPTVIVEPPARPTTTPPARPTAAPTQAPRRAPTVSRPAPQPAPAPAPQTASRPAAPAPQPAPETASRPAPQPAASAPQPQAPAQPAPEPQQPRPVAKGGKYKIKLPSTG